MSGATAMNRMFNLITVALDGILFFTFVLFLVLYNPLAWGFPI